MRVWVASWRGWPLAALAVAAGCLVAAGNWWSTSRAFADDAAPDLATHASERASDYLGWAVGLVAVAVVLRALKHGRTRPSTDSTRHRPGAQDERSAPLTASVQGARRR